MPNHVENDLVITGDPETLRAFVAYAEGPVGSAVGSKETALLSAHRFIPYPEEYQRGHYCDKCGDPPKAEEHQGMCPTCGEPMKDGYNRGGYEWCIEHWGTKWGLYEVELTEGDFDNDRLEYTFQSAWSPPILVIQAMSKQFPSLSFAMDYFEGGMGFMGSCEYENGQEVEAASAPYHGNRGG